MSNDVPEATGGIVKPPKQHRVLVLDGDKQEVKLLRQHLESAGYQTIITTSASQALAHIEEKEVDLLLLDPELPDVDGEELCRRLRCGSKTAAVPIIFLTDPLEETDTARMLESEADDFVSRPFSRAALVLRVRSLLRLKELHDAQAQGVARRPAGKERATGAGKPGADGP